MELEHYKILELEKESMEHFEEADMVLADGPRRTIKKVIHKKN